MSKPEAKVEAHLVRRAKGIGGEVRKLQWIGRRGAPDRLVIVPCDVWFVELKKKGAVPEPHQDREHKRLRALGAVVLVFDSIEAIDAHFDAYRLGKIETPARVKIPPYGEINVAPNPRGRIIDKSV